MHVRRKRTPATTSQRSFRRSSRSTFSTTFFLHGATQHEQDRLSNPNETGQC
jgi:hypothetical protein